MSRRYRRRPHYGVPERRDVHRQAFLILLKGIYQATKRMEATHWLAATEKSLQRLVEQDPDSRSASSGRRPTTVGRSLPIS